MPKPGAPPLSEKVAQKCRDMVYDAAARYGVPPVFITAHIPSSAAHQARLEVQAVMVNELGLRRWQVAKIFNRDLRRMRASVLANAPKPPRPKRPRPLWKEVGNQLVWNFAVPKEKECPVPPLKALMRGIPEQVKSKLAPEERDRLREFYERQAMALR